jgi:NAD(P)-dependent dehydrogenase (short-subunit alcohol dehydrogenase family)
MSEFSGKRVLVTGGTKGAGKAIADRFLRSGANVIVIARAPPAERADSHFIQADVSTCEGTTKVIREISNRHNGVDIVIHNVGGSSAPSGGFITITDKLWQQAFDENLFPAVGWTVAFCLHDRTRIGRHHSHFLHPTNAASL